MKQVLSFKPCYKWTTFNTLQYLKVRQRGLGF